MDQIKLWATSRGRNGQVALILGGLFTCGLLVTVVLVFRLHSVAPLVGSVAGVILFLVSVFGWLTMLSEDQRVRTNLRQRVPLARRRTYVGVAGALWVSILLLFSRVTVLPEIVMGTLNVFVVLVLTNVFRATEQEAQEQSDRRAAEVIDKEIMRALDEDPAAR